MMQITCQDRERVLLDGSKEQWAALQLHAESCAACALEVRAWKALSLAAAELRNYQESPALWSRIETALALQAKGSGLRKTWRERLSLWRCVPLGWQTALVAALVLLIAFGAGRIDWHSRSGPSEASNPLLKDGTLAEVERTERDYRKAIDKLATQAKAPLHAPDSTLMANYREKLILLDGAIEELRIEAARNPSNAHLRYQLLAMYQEKQETLQEVLETKP
jgi:hypothetical protein